VSPSGLELDVAAFEVAALVQALTKRLKSFRRGIAFENADASQLRHGLAKHAAGRNKRQQEGCNSSSIKDHAGSTSVERHSVAA
jgi:hypothetical protein